MLNSDFTPVRRTEKDMRSSSSYADATLVHELSEPLSVLDEHRLTEGCVQSVSDPPTHCVRAAGALRYNRESDNHRINLTTILPAAQPLTEHPVKCDYCGEKAKPSLDLTWALHPQTVPLFCCAQRKQLCKMLVKQRCLVEGRCDMRTGTPVSLEDKPTATDGRETEEILFQGKETEDHNKFIMDLQSGLGELSELRIYEDHSIQLPAAETFASTSKVLSFRLSCAPENECWTVIPCCATEMHFKIKEEEEQVLVPFCDHKPLNFGICHHQDGAEFRQKYYSNCMTFLTVFPDGSAQVFYPSGLLAVIVVVTEESGRVCIVYDDSDASYQPIRAVFQSDGKATCYHNNGNIWLTLNSSGGQCLDEEGARVRRWSWGSQSLTPLHPIFLSLNKTVGVRVLGKDQVFVSFLARGQQAKFSVGTCCTQGECETDGAASGPSVLKEELFVLAARTRIHLTIQELRQYLLTSSHPRLLKTSQASHLHVVAQKASGSHF
ncbi:glutamate-rich protein 6-like [Centropristis striata]|uniref:glutamate-rich protein 6-like n=1 Tax=Centropristis striata TaxID=184440 RepID=UPI0027E14250|nr:glutamate-rich protein 6-like [Centropristis striata]XP_059200744.1 glutamate-rich protein 6-like [Centropristis striata]